LLRNVNCPLVSKHESRLFVHRIGGAVFPGGRAGSAGTSDRFAKECQRCGDVRECEAAGLDSGNGRPRGGECRQDADPRRPARAKAAWTGVVDKMIRAYKAPVSEADAAAIVDSLQATKGAK
jgi:hypothetical protein